MGLITQIAETSMDECEKFRSIVAAIQKEYRNGRRTCTADSYEEEA